jgi:hypothetical protein
MLLVVEFPAKPGTNKWGKKEIMGASLTVLPITITGSLPGVILFCYNICSFNFFGNFDTTKS